MVPALIVGLAAAACGGRRAPVGGEGDDGGPVVTMSDAAGEGASNEAPDATVDAAFEAAADAPADQPNGASVDASQPPFDAAIRDATGDGSQPPFDAAIRDATGDGSGDTTPGPDSSPGSPAVLVSGLYDLREVAVDEVNVYFSALSTVNDQSDAIYQVPKNGGTPIELSVNDRQPLSLVSDGAYVYWNDTLDPFAIRRVVVGGNGATTLTTDTAGIADMAMSPTTLFWAFDGSVQSMPKGGGQITALAPAPAGAGLGVAIDASYVYLAGSTSPFDATITRVPQSGGSATTLATLTTNVNVLATDGANVYFVSGDALSAVPTAGGAVSVLATGFAGTTSLVLDPETAMLYAGTIAGNGPYGSVLRVPVTGGPPFIVAGAQWGVLDVAVDATSVYWTNFGGPNGAGAVMKAPKWGATDAGGTQAYDAGAGTSGAPDAAGPCAPGLGLCNGVCIDGDASNTCPVSWSYVTVADALAMAVDDSNVYWTESMLPNGGSVMALPKSGGTALALYASSTTLPIGLAVDATHVYWGESGTASDGTSLDSIKSLPLAAAGGTPTVLTTATGAEVLALSGSTVCFGGSLTVGCLPAIGGPVTTLDTVQSGYIAAMAADATNLYWTSFSTNGALFSAPLVGGAVNLLVPHTDRPEGVAVDGQNVYWVGNGTSTVNAMPIAGGPVTPLATGPGSAEYLVVDSGYLFWSAGLDSNDGAILEMPVTGGTPTVLAWDIYGAGPIAVDAQYVYFITQNGSIGKAAR